MHLAVVSTHTLNVVRSASVSWRSFVSACECVHLCVSVYIHIHHCVGLCLHLHGSVYRTLNVRTHSDANVSPRLDASFVKDFWDVLYPGSKQSRLYTTLHFKSQWRQYAICLGWALCVHINRAVLTRWCNLEDHVPNNNFLYILTPRNVMKEHNTVH